MMIELLNGVKRVNYESSGSVPAGAGSIEIQEIDGQEVVGQEVVDGNNLTLEFPHASTGFIQAVRELRQSGSTILGNIGQASDEQAIGAVLNGIEALSEYRGPIMGVPEILEQAKMDAIRRQTVTNLKGQLRSTAQALYDKSPKNGISPNLWNAGVCPEGFKPVTGIILKVLKVGKVEQLKKAVGNNSYSRCLSLASKAGVSGLTRKEVSELAELSSKLNEKGEALLPVPS
jgi:hypothetical protein